MDAVKVAVVNWTAMHEDDFQRGFDALTKQLYEFQHVWGVKADLTPFASPRPDDRAEDQWGLILLGGPGISGDRLEAAVTPYYQQDLTWNNLPLVRVFLAGPDCEKNWTHRASHELLEMLIDPDHSAHVYTGAKDDPRNGLWFYAKRVCDPCAKDPYRIDGWPVSDFVYPAWFGLPGRDGKYVHTAEDIKGPFQVSQGCSISVRPWRAEHGLGKIPFPP